MIQLDSEEAMKATALAMSSGVPRRPSGVREMAYFCVASSISSMASRPSVTVTPGETPTTRIFFGPSSMARTRVMTSTAALVPL